MECTSKATKTDFATDLRCELNIWFRYRIETSVQTLDINGDVVNDQEQMTRKMSLTRDVEMSLARDVEFDPALESHDRD